MAEPGSQDATQQATQHAYDPRRLGRNNSGLREQDISDVICILHPASQSALNIVAITAELNPQHILQNWGMFASSNSHKQAKDLALRFSANVRDPLMGFVFGRHQLKCDINLDPSNTQKRVSNTHFRIYVNGAGVLMIEDSSTNGTIVDDHTLGSKKTHNFPKTRMLSNSSIIQILSPNDDDIIKFIVRIPSREGHWDDYRSKFKAYIQHIAIAEQERAVGGGGAGAPDLAVRGAFAGATTAQAHLRQFPVPEPLAASQHGMKWDGNGRYKCTGVLGKGAFAIVYQVATTDTGEVYAAKELERKRFMKQGHLDARLDNEMKIMKALRHPNIVQYVDVCETDQHFYIIMEYIPYGDVQGYMSEHGTLPETLARDMSRQIFDALGYLHKKNITHRDIKPDNILICSKDPFNVKLTDFGLSKVVKSNETFLKTFCGTLLYCAPEVFPHYDNYIAGKRAKRRREDREPKGRSYSQLVDIWSYAAVLWFVLCGKPPFEGVMDANGRAMFTKIMETSLDTSPLEEKGVSSEAIDLLVQMLNTDPAVRPSEAELLRHPWLTGRPRIANTEMDIGLDPIVEQDEDIDEPELDASQLNINDDRESEDLAPSSASGNLIEGRGQKRLKADGFASANPTGQLRETAPGLQPGSVNVHKPMEPHRQRKLFGEISGPTLQSSGTLGQPPLPTFPHVAHDLPLEDSQMVSDDESSAHSQIDQSYLAEKYLPGYQSRSAAPSLNGTESMVRDLRMASPLSSDRRGDTPYGEPGTPTSLPASSDAERGAKEDLNNVNDRETKPKSKPFSRYIDLPLPPSFFYDPYDPSTHNIQFASKESGMDLTNGNITTKSVSLLGGSLARSDTRMAEQQQSTGGEPAATITAPFAATMGLGKIVSTVDSFLSVTITLNTRITSWGRTPSNTHVHPDGNDTRIPKVAFEIWFHGSGLPLGNEKLSDGAQKASELERSAAASEPGRLSTSQSIADVNAEYSAEQISKCDNLQALILTQSKFGIMVNGVKLPYRDSKGRRCYGRLQTGDEILVSTAKDGTVLKFNVSFYYGEAARRRGPNDKPFVVTSV